MIPFWKEYSIQFKIPCFNLLSVKYIFKILHDQCIKTLMNFKCIAVHTLTQVTKYKSRCKRIEASCIIRTFKALVKTTIRHRFRGEGLLIYWGFWRQLGSSASIIPYSTIVGTRLPREHPPNHVKGKKMGNVRIENALKVKIR